MRPDEPRLPSLARRTSFVALGARRANDWVAHKKGEEANRVPAQMRSSTLDTGRRPPRPSARPIGYTPGEQTDVSAPPTPEQQAASERKFALNATRVNVGLTLVCALLWAWESNRLQPDLSELLRFLSALWFFVCPTASALALSMNTKTPWNRARAVSVSLFAIWLAAVLLSALRFSR